VKVFFATLDATAAAVTRRVPRPAAGRGTLTAMFAGPTDFETATGLVFARVRLTGGCASGGSTFTIASEFMPTLKRFPTVDFVKRPAGADRAANWSGRLDPNVP
jgi:hypothetical protein